MRADAQQPRSSDTRLRGALLMPLCALGVHQLCYYLAFGADAGARLRHDGHAYLSTVEPFALLATAVAIGLLIGCMVRAWHSPSELRRGGYRRVWIACSATLFAIYCGQELFEGVFAAGHAAGLAGIFGHGGWIALPAAIVIGAALAMTLRLAESVIALVASRARLRARPTTPAAQRASQPRRDWRLVPLSGSVAGRAPPARPPLSSI